MQILRNPCRRWSQSCVLRSGRRRAFVHPATRVLSPKRWHRRPARALNLLHRLSTIFFRRLQQVSPIIDSKSWAVSRKRDSRIAYDRSTRNRRKYARAHTRRGWLSRFKFRFERSGSLSSGYLENTSPQRRVTCRCTLRRLGRISVGVSKIARNRNLRGISRYTSPGNTGGQIH